MRKFLFDVILGIFIAIGACVVGIIAIMDKVDELKRRSYGFAEVVDNLVTSIKDLIHHLLYGYHHNRSAGAGYGAYSTRNFSYSTTNGYKSMNDWWNSTSKSDTDIKAESEYPREDDDKEEASSGH